MAVRQGLIPVAAILLLATANALAQQSAIRRWTEGLKQVRTGQAGTTISEPIDAPGTYALLRREGAGYVIVGWNRNRLALPYRPGDEILGWDTDRRQAFLAFHADVSATGVNRWACPRGKVNDEPYTACTSRVVTSDKAGNLVGGLLTAGMATAAGSMRELDPAVVDEIARRVDFPAKAYAQQKAWALADLTPQSSLAEVNRVAIAYGNDLTPEERAFLKDMTARIKVATQQRDFETATTGAELSGFIARYEKDDPAGLVAQARAILPGRLAKNANVPHVWPRRKHSARPRRPHAGRRLLASRTSGRGSLPECRRIAAWPSLSGMLSSRSRPWSAPIGCDAIRCSRRVPADASSSTVSIRSPDRTPLHFESKISKRGLRVASLHRQREVTHGRTTLSNPIPAAASPRRQSGRFPEPDVSDIHAYLPAM